MTTTSVRLVNAADCGDQGPFDFDATTECVEWAYLSPTVRQEARSTGSVTLVDASGYRSKTVGELEPGERAIVDGGEGEWYLLERAEG